MRYVSIISVSVHLIRSDQPLNLPPRMAANVMLTKHLLSDSVQAIIYWVWDGTIYMQRDILGKENIKC